MGNVLLNVPVMELPVPLAGTPVIIAVLFLVHEKVVPATLFGLVMVMVKLLPGQMVWLAGNAKTVGMGLMVTVTKVLVSLSHPVAVIFAAA